MQFVVESDSTVTLKRDGTDDVKDVRFRRAFPWSKAREYISVRDEKGKEQLMIGSLDGLPADQRSVVEDWLEKNSFIPVVKRVDSVNTDFGYQEWHVETDRGRLSFRVQEREDVRFLPDGRFSIKDVDGNIYAMPRLSDLDQKTVRALEPVL